MSATIIPAILSRFKLPLFVLALLVGAYQAGVNAERSRGEAAELRIRIETVTADLEIAREAAERARATSEALGQRARTLQERLDDAPTSQTLDADACGPYSDADLDRLRQLLR